MHKQKNISFKGLIIYKLWEGLRENNRKCIGSNLWKRVMWGIVTSFHPLSSVSFSHFHLHRQSILAHWNKAWQCCSLGDWVLLYKFASFIPYPKFNMACLPIMCSDIPKTVLRKQMVIFDYYIVKFAFDGPALVLSC